MDGATFIITFIIIMLLVFAVAVLIPIIYTLVFPTINERLPELCTHPEYYYDDMHYSKCDEIGVTP